MAKKVDLITLKILVLKICRSTSELNFKNKSRGFTLVEILIVLAIIASLATVLVPALFSKSDREFKAEIRNISVLSKDIRNTSMLKKNTHRLVISMDKEKGVTYWVEEAQGKVLLDSNEERQKFLVGRKNLTEDELKKIQEKNPFQMSQRFNRKGPRQFPNGLLIKQVELQGISEKFTDGKIEIYYMPEGFAELAVIQVQTKDEAMKWTLVTAPLTGQIDIFNGHMSLDKLEDRE